MNRDFAIDWLSGVLVGLFAIVNGVALLMVHSRLTSDTAASQPTQSASATMGGRIVLLVVVEIAAIVLLWRGYGYLSEKWQTRVKLVAKGTVGGVILLMGYRVWTLAVGPAWQYFVGILLLALLKRRVEPNGFAWIAWDMIGVSIAVIAAVIGGSTLAPGLIIGLMVLFLLYDKIAVDWTNIMGDLGMQPQYQVIDVPHDFLEWDVHEQQAYLKHKVSVRELANFIRALHDMEWRENHRFDKSELAEIAVRKMNNE